MGKKIEFTQEQTDEIIRLYNEEMLGTPTIGKMYGVSKPIINKLLKKEGVQMGPSGRKFTGGKVAARKRYDNKPEIKIKKEKYYKGWAKDNREYLREKHTQWRDENREHVRQYGRDYERIRRATDPKYRLIARTRTAVWTCLKEANVAKYRSTFEMLGYGIEELMNHLEPLFTEGMTWDNYGEWHVDHKTPMSSFEFETTECDGFKECWKLANLQPLWELDNLEKGSKIA